MRNGRPGSRLHSDHGAADPSQGLRGRATGRPPERSGAHPDGDQAPLHRAARGGRPARDRGHQLRLATRHPAARRRRRAHASLPHDGAAGRPLPGPRRRIGAASSVPRRPARRRWPSSRPPATPSRAQHRHDRRRRPWPRSRRCSTRPATRAGGGAATSRPPSAARTRAPSTPAGSIDVGLRLLELGVDEICFGDTIGVGVPSQVHDLTARATAPASRSTGLPTTSTTRAAPPWPTSGQPSFQ